MPAQFTLQHRRKRPLGMRGLGTAAHSGGQLQAMTLTPGRTRGFAPGKSYLAFQLLFLY